MNDTDELRQALQHNLELVRLLSDRIDMLERPLEDNAARMISVMWMLRAMYQCAPNQHQIAQYLERLTAQTHAQPGVVLHGGKSVLKLAQEHLDWMQKPGIPTD